MRRAPSVPSLPNELWAHIVHSGPVNAGLFALTRVTRDASYELVGYEHGLNRLQAEAFAKVAYLGRNVFLTGGAGVGKSFTAQAIVGRLRRQFGDAGSIGIVAPTGAASIIASTPTVTAATIHRFFGIKQVKRPPDSPAAMRRREPTEAELIMIALDADPVDERDADTLNTSVQDAVIAERLRSLKVLVIDEVSMVDRAQLELINDALQLARNSSEPWAGVNVLVCGDLYQLPPVCPGREIAWCFQSPLWDTLQTVELTQIVRQGSDADFAAVLSRMRKGRMLPPDYNFLNNRSCKANRTPTMTLLPTNRKVDVANAEALDRVPGTEVAYEPEWLLEEILATQPHFESRPYHARSSGRVLWPKPPPTLCLKVGSPVRCTKNTYGGSDQKLQVANGQRGVVKAMAHRYIDVKWDALGNVPAHRTRVWRARRVRRQTWTSVRGKPVVASATYFPLTLAFASTIYACQGFTLNCPVDADPRSFSGGPGNWSCTPASAYVCLSRATEIGLLRLLEPLRPGHVRVSPAVAARFPG